MLICCSGKYFKAKVKDKNSLNSIGCLAIAPFNNLSNSQEGSVIVTDLLATSFVANTVFRVVSAGDMNEELKRENVFVDDKINLEKACKVAKNLNAHGVLMGTISEWEYVKSSSESYEPKIAFSLQLYNSKNCSLAWSTKIAKSSSAFAGGGKESLSSLGMKAVDKITNKLLVTLDERILDHNYRCGSHKDENTYKCARDDKGMVDFNKCPQAIPEIRLGIESVSLEGNELIFNKSINFVPAKKYISPSSRKLLKKLAAFINKNQFRKIIVESFILSKYPKKNPQRTLDRSGEVKKYLIKSGLEKTEVLTINYIIESKSVAGRKIPSLRIVILK